MTQDQIKTIYDGYMAEATRPDGRKSTLGEYVRFLSDCNVELTTSKDMVIIDEGNQLVNAICMNDDMIGQADFPVKIISLPFDHITCMECVMSKANLKKFLDSGFLSSISAAKKEFILKWFDSNPIQGQAINEATPFYDRDVKVIPSHVVGMKRDDGLISPVKPGSLVNVSEEEKKAQSGEEDTGSTGNEGDTTEGA